MSSRLMRCAGLNRLSAALVILCQVAPWQALASPPGPEAFTGVWSYTNGPGEEDLRRRAVETATESFPGFVRGSARKRLVERTKPPRELELRVVGDRLDLARDRSEVSLPLDGQPVAVEGNGRRGRMSARLDGTQLVVTSEGEGGRREARYALSADGSRLTVSVRVNGERLTRPLEYQSTYHRK